MNDFERMSPLLTDLYELTMMGGYFHKNHNKDATFSLYIRPNKKRNYFVFAGLETALTYLENLRFSMDEINYLASLGLFSDDFLCYLENFRFSGDVFAMDEGSIFFGNEPVMEIRAPLMEAQLVETFLINTINFETMIATKALRCIHSASGRGIADFSLRRTQGTDAGMKVARSSYIAGFMGTSNVLAGKRFSIPVIGTMAHSFVSSFKKEEDAFDSYADIYPDNCILLIDTYDTLKGAENAVKTGKKLRKKGYDLKGVRLDSGDMADLSIKVRNILDSNGFTDSKIFASSGFDEYKIKDVVSKGAKIDAFGVGTKMGVSSDAPYFDTVYKLSRFAGRDVRKLSKNKTTLGGEKQVFRVYGQDGKMDHDITGSRMEIIEGARPMLLPFMEKGRIIKDLKPLDSIRDFVLKEFNLLDLEFKSIDERAFFKVYISDELKRIQQNI